MSLPFIWYLIYTLLILKCCDELVNSDWSFRLHYLGITDKENNGLSSLLRNWDCWPFNSSFNFSWEAENFLLLSTKNTKVKLKFSNATDAVNS